MKKKDITDILSAFVPMITFVVIISMFAAVIHSVVASGLVVPMLWIGYTAWVVLGIFITLFIISK